MGGRDSDFQWLVPLAIATFTGTFVSRRPLLWRRPYFTIDASTEVEAIAKAATLVGQGIDDAEVEMNRSASRNREYFTMRWTEFQSKKLR
ncbi:hypothetical protein I180019D1_08810 [Alistipes sp. i18-0019-D1]|jgi:hypothetical protein